MKSAPAIANKFVYAATGICIVLHDPPCRLPLSDVYISPTIAFVIHDAVYSLEIILTIQP